MKEHKKNLSLIVCLILLCLVPAGCNKSSDANLPPETFHGLWGVTSRPGPTTALRIDQDSSFRLGIGILVGASGGAFAKQTLTGTWTASGNRLTLRGDHLHTAEQGDATRPVDRRIETTLDKNGSLTVTQSEEPEIPKGTVFVKSSGR
jgi:hypothetical protein